MRLAASGWRAAGVATVAGHAGTRPMHRLPLRAPGFHAVGWGFLNAMTTAFAGELSPILASSIRSSRATAWPEGALGEGLSVPHITLRNGALLGLSSQFQAIREFEDRC